MKTKLVDFDIEKARNGAIAFACNLDHSGARHCRIICFDLMGEFPIAAAVRYKYADSVEERIHRFGIDGMGDFELKLEENEYEAGDIITCEHGSTSIYMIVSSNYKNEFINAYVTYGASKGIDYNNSILLGYNWNIRLATEEEKQRLFDALAKESKRWNSEKKCIEELPRKTSVFKPFDKVLVRDGDIDTWGADIFLEYSNLEFQFRCFRCVWRQCIPYEGNESLLGTSNKPIIL